MNEEKKKILYIITQSDFGGAQRYVFDLSTHLNADFDVLVAAGKDGGGELFSRLERCGIKTVRLKHLKRAINPWRDLLAFFELRQLIKTEKPNIIHLNSSKAGILGSFAAKFQVSRFTFQVVYTANGWVFNEPLNWLKKKIYLWLEKLTSKYKNKIICVSEYDRQTALKYGFPAKKLATIHNGIDFTNLHFLEKEASRQELFNRLDFKFHASCFKLVGSIANLYPAKGIEYLVEAANIANHKSQITNCIFAVIGEGAERLKLEKLIKKYNLTDKFFLLGHLENASQYLKAFDIFILPSVKEGFPYAILEAMSAGLPIISAKVGGIPEMIVDGQNGFLVEPKNPQQLAEKIAYLLKNPEISQNLQEQTIAAIKELSLAKMLEKTKEIYLSF